MPFPGAPRRSPTTPSGPATWNPRRAARRGFHVAGPEGVVGERRGAPGNGIVRNGEANLASWRAAPEDHTERQAAGGAEEEAEGQEGELARAHAGFGPLSESADGRRSRGRA